jgi:hypothetical protein
VSERIIALSSSDGTDPLTNGRRYELVFRPDLARCEPVRALAGVAVVLLVLAWRAGVVRLGVSARRRDALAVAAIVAAALAAGVPRGWDEIGIGLDTKSYVEVAAGRPVLYPTFIAAFDRSPGDPPAVAPPPPDPFPCYTDPGARYLDAVRAQKVACVLAAGVLAGVLALAIGPWLAGLLAYVAIAADIATGSDLAASWNVRVLLSEGLNHPFVLLYVAAVLAYVLRPSWIAGLALAAVLALLVLNRPSNSVLVLAFVVLWLRDLEAGGWRRASLRAAVFIAVYAAPLLVACAQVQAKWGHFRLHAYTGKHVLAPALELATADDLDAFDDPAERAFVRACVVDHAADRIEFHPDWATGAEPPNYIDRNIYAIEAPACAEAVKDAPVEPHAREFFLDDLMTRIGRKLIARHPIGFARIVLFHFRLLADAERHLPIAAAIVIALALYRRRRDPLLLFFLFFALLPWVGMLPACLFNFPLSRYVSQFQFAETLTLPLFACVVARRQS